MRLEVKQMFWDRAPRRTSLDQGDAFDLDGGLPSPPISHQQRWPEQDTPRAFARAVCSKRYLEVLAKKAVNIYRPGLALEGIFGEFAKKLGVLSPHEARFWVRALGCMEAVDELKSTTFSKEARQKAQARHDEVDVETPLTVSEVSARFDLLLYGGERASTTRGVYGARDFAPLAQCVRKDLGVVEGIHALFESINPREYGAFFYHFGSTQGHEDEVIALMHEYVDTSHCFAWGSPYTQSMSNMLERCPDPDYLERAAEVVARAHNAIEGASGRLPMMCAEREDVYRWFDKLKVPMTAQQVRELYVRFGQEGFDDLMKRVTMRYNQNRRDALMRALWPVANTEMAPWMLKLAQKEESRAIARHWLHGEGVHATLGLMQLVKSRGKQRNQAILELRAIAEQGHLEEIRGLLEHVQSPTARELIVQEVLEFEAEEVEEATADELPQWARALLDDNVFPEDLELGKARDFFELEQAPLVSQRTTGHAIPVEVMARVLALAHGAFSREMRKGTQGSPERVAREALEQTCRGWLEQVRADVDEPQLGAWLWYVLEMWWSKKKPYDAAYCLALVGYCATDRELVELVPRIKSNKKWFPTQDTKRHVREVVDGFAMVGTTTGWMLLDEFAEHGTSEWLRAHASRARDMVCKARGWSEAQWQDRIVSHAGLNAKGTRMFDYGGRQFELRFRGAFDVEFVNDDGDHFERLPPARKSDDVDKVRAARQDYKSVKAQLEQVIERQTQRFERAMLTMQSWPAEAWWTWVANHPLLLHFARKLIWVKQVEGMPDEYTVLTLEGTTIDVDYEEVPCGEGATMRVLHPADLDDEARMRWVELLADFEIVQPFAQLEREVYKPGQRFEEEVIEALGSREWWRWGAAMHDDYGERYWERRDHDSILSAIWHVQGPWCVVIVRDERGWGEVRPESGEGLPGAGAYLCLGQEPDPSTVVPWSQIPAPLYSEVYRAARKIVDQSMR